MDSICPTWCTTVKRWDDALYPRLSSLSSSLFSRVHTLFLRKCVKARAARNVPCNCAIYLEAPDQQSIVCSHCTLFRGGWRRDSVYVQTKKGFSIVVTEDIAKNAFWCHSHAVRGWRNAPLSSGIQFVPPPPPPKSPLFPFFIFLPTLLSGLFVCLRPISRVTPV